MDAIESRSHEPARHFNAGVQSASHPGFEIENSNLANYFQHRSEGWPNGTQEPQQRREPAEKTNDLPPSV
jgi:hypothetical protein